MISDSPPGGAPTTNVEDRDYDVTGTYFTGYCFAGLSAGFFFVGSALGVRVYCNVLWQEMDELDLMGHYAKRAEAADALEKGLAVVDEVRG